MSKVKVGYICNGVPAHPSEVREVSKLNNTLFLKLMEMAEEDSPSGCWHLGRWHVGQFITWLEENYNIEEKSSE